MFKRKPLSIHIALLCSASALTPVLAQDTVLEEVMVTATRRSESVQDIPYNISAISGDSIARRGIGDVSELIKGIPGVSGPDLGSRAGINNSIVMRGINTSDAGQNTVGANISAPPVSTYLNETPMFTNLKMLDIERVEVLRGPQGTLYGSGAMGGTLRFITKRPVLGENSAEFRAGLSSSKDAGGLNTEAEVIANVAMGDNFAMRFALSHDKQAGVIDSTSLVVTDAGGAPVLADPSDVDSGLVYRREDDVDDGKVLASRVSALWQIGEETEAVFTWLHQDESWGHSTIAYIGDDPSLGGGPDSWEDSSHQLDPVERTVDVASLEVMHEFGFASFTSATSFTNDESEPDRDTSDFYVNLDVNFGYYFGFPRILVLDNSIGEAEAFTQELRLVSNNDGPFDWVIGAFYNKEDQKGSNRNQMFGLGAWMDDPDAAGGLGPMLPDFYPYFFGNTIGDFVEYYLGATRPSKNEDEVFTLDTLSKFEEKALYGEATYRLTDSWQMTVGARVFRQTLDRSMRQTLPLCGAGCSDDFDPVNYTGNPIGLTEARHKSSFNDSIFKFNTSYDLNEETMLYLTVSQGFRRGGANALPVAGAFFDPDFPLEYQPDKLLNTEIGIKGLAWNNRLSYSLAAYNIDWEDVQIEAFTGGGFKGVVNAEDAQSKGVELELQALLTENLSATLGYSHVKAEISKDTIAGGAPIFKGDRLPYVPENQLSLALDYNRAFGSGYEFRLHGDGNYRSNFSTQLNDQQALNNYMVLDGYTLVNASATIATQKWSAQAFIKNITNEEGLSSVFVLAANGAGAAGEFGRRGFVNRPRTIGLRFTYWYN
jgi:iron complex outermembrane receptor protein